MGKMYWAIVAVVLVGGLTTAIYFGLQGKSVPLIKWSHFANPEEASQAVKGRMSQELSRYQLYFIGPHPRKPFHIQTAVNITVWLRSQGRNVLVVDRIMLEQNPELQNLKPDLVLDLGKEKDRFLEGVKAVNVGTKVIVLAPNIYVTHYSAQSPVAQMQEQLGNYVVLSFINFPGSRDEEKEFEFPCRTGDGSGTQLDLGCFVLGQARSKYLKKKVDGKTPGFLNLVRSREYMFFLGK